MQQACLGVTEDSRTTEFLLSNQGTAAATRVVGICWKQDDDPKSTMNMSNRLADLDLNSIWARKG